MFPGKLLPVVRTMFLRNIRLEVCGVESARDKRCPRVISLE